MSIWEGGYGEQPEDEREGAWHDSDGVDLPFLPEQDWPIDAAGPEYWLYRRDEEGDNHGPPG